MCTDVYYLMCTDVYSRKHILAQASRKQILAQASRKQTRASLAQPQTFATLSIEYSTEHFYIFCQTTICTEKAMAQNTMSLQAVTETVQPCFLREQLNRVCKNARLAVTRKNCSTPAILRETSEWTSY